jgi:hypothetical protein
MSFAASIAALGLVQAALVALPRLRRFAWLEAFRSPWWALVPALSIVVVIGIVAWQGESATALSWLALVAVPPFAALALGWLVRGGRPAWALAVVPLFALAWASTESLAGEAAATLLTAFGCIGLGWLLASVAPPRWLEWGIYAMAAVDTVFVAADLLQDPNAVLTAASPSGLPRLQVVDFGHAVMGFGDLFVAATLGCLLAVDRRVQLQAAALVAVLALAFDLLFFAVDTLPATVPVALALGLVSWRAGVARLASDRGDPGDGEDQHEARGGQADSAP